MKKKGLGYCSECDGVVSFSAKTCPHCGADFTNDDTYETIVSEDGYEYYKYSNNEGDAFISDMPRAQREQKEKEDLERRLQEDEDEFEHRFELEGHFYPLILKMAKLRGIKDEFFYEELKASYGLTDFSDTDLNKLGLTEDEFAKYLDKVNETISGMEREVYTYYENLPESEKNKLKEMAKDLKKGYPVDMKEIKLPNFKKETTSNGDGFSLDDNHWFKTLLVAIVLVFIAIFMVVALR